MLSQITDWLRGSHRTADAQAHMTFGQTSVGRSLTRTGLFLKKQLWIWPIIAVVLLSAIGYLVSGAIKRTMEDTLRSELTTLLNVEKSMLEKWLKVQESSAMTLANDPEIRRLVAQIIDAREAPPVAGTPTNPAGAEKTLDDNHRQLAKNLEPAMSAHDFVGYVVVDKRQTVSAAYTKEIIGTNVAQYESFFTRCLDGKTTVSAPLPSLVMLKDKSGKLRSGIPTMFVCAPVRDDNFQVIGVLAMRIKPEEEFTDILKLGRSGKSGETYAVNKDGLMVSNSRFDEDLILLGLLPDREGAASILNIDVRDPGGDMTKGYRPSVRRHERPLTKACAEAVAGTMGVDIEGYRDYRGVPVVGAWAWLPEYEMGVLTEIDRDEAFRPLTILHRTFYGLYALLGVSAIAIFVFTIVVARLQREARKAAMEAKQLGQYRLEEKIGEGAMGIVYRGQHAMLRRPTAIKMLNLDKVNEQSIQRFEHEVQITCRLNNPHTVAIYDYGRTPEGLFYYAMEYLDGIDLQALVQIDGPQPEARVISILKQVCSSLYEAHTSGLVHRDIKPANIMICRRGGESDVVKVLDFGLVKAINEEKGKGPGGISGTPLYMSPEAIQTPDLVDVRSDLYAVGAVGYFLLTGEPVFQARSLVELYNFHVTATPEAPSHKAPIKVSAELDNAILRCLDKDRARRPQTARDLVALLDRSPVTSSWTLADADDWWLNFERQHPAGSEVDTTPATTPRTLLGGMGGKQRIETKEPISKETSTPQPTNTDSFDRTIDQE